MARKKPEADFSIGHNSGALDRDRLRSLVERIEAIEAERADLAGDIRDVYQEAKSSGFDVAAIRTSAPG